MVASRFHSQVVAVACACCLLAPRAIHAQTTPSADTVDDLLQRGVAARIAGDDLTALSTFEAARSLCHCSEALAQVALAKLALGRWVEAERDLSLALREGGAWIESARPQLQAELDRVSNHLGWLEVRVSPASSVVSIDGHVFESSQQTDRRVRVEPGRLRVRVEAPGHVASERIVTAVEGDTTRVSIDLALEIRPIGSNLLEEQRRRLNAPSTEPALRSPEIATLVAAGAGLLGGAVGVALGQQRWGEYNDDSRCLVAGRSRSENCGELRVQGEVATALGLGLTGASLTSATIIAVLRWTRRRTVIPSVGLLTGASGQFACSVHLSASF